MTGPARKLVALLGASGPLTLSELARDLQYPPHRVLGFITEARSAGVTIRCERVPGEFSTFAVPADTTSLVAELTHSATE